MTASDTDKRTVAARQELYPMGLFWLLVAAIGAGLFFSDGVVALTSAWQTPEYSHGPLIPILSALLFLRQLKDVPINDGPIRDRWPGVIVVTAALAFGAVGKLANIPDIVAYATILWVGGILLISFGWSTGKHFWPPVLHLVYMLPLPDTFYYKLSNWLQMVSSEMGVWILKLLAIPVFLEGNIIDLGVIRLHVADACSGLRYLFPILSFSYIFAVLYRGPMWHKAILLISAAPITVLMNAVRIALGGIIANRYGLQHLEGFSHFFEGWVIFIACILLLFGLAWLLLRLNPQKMSLTEALDLETEGLVAQAKRIALVRPSAALIAAAALALGSIAAWQVTPGSRHVEIQRDSFGVFPRALGDWQQEGPARRFDKDIEAALQADDYRQVTYQKGKSGPDVSLFMAWYADQSNGGVHSPEICLPSSGWEIAWLERSDLAPSLGLDGTFNINRAIIQKGEARMMVFYWFQQGKRQVAWDFAAKFFLLMDAVRTGQSNGGIVRLTTQIARNESDAAAEARLLDLTRQVIEPLPRFFPLQ